MRVMISSPAVGVVYRQEVQAITPGRTLVVENSTRYVLHLALKPCRNTDEVNQERVASISPFGSIRMELSRQDLPTTLSFYLDPNYITTLTAPVQFIAIYDAPAIMMVTPGVPFDPANFGEPVQNIVIFSTPGTYAWRVPKHISRIRFRVTGGGGGGAGGAANGPAGGGGGGGGTVYGYLNVTPDETLTIVVGAGGAGGGPGAAGSAGGASRIIRGNAVLVEATGGSGGSPPGPGTGGGWRDGWGGAGGGGNLDASVATGIVIRGMPGGRGLGAACDEGINARMGGPGGASFWGGGGTSTCNGAGGSGLLGGGGGGGGCNSTTGYAGGAGGNGIVIIEY